uniref:Complex III subunit 9 n=1 Tax=Eptatretus burgeri TaxID=7764 RepID=A0A8C4R157_EPTBU
MGFVSLLYQRGLRRMTVFLFGATVGALMLEQGVDLLGDTVFDSLNKGKQWKDIKHLYEKEQ